MRLPVAYCGFFLFAMILTLGYGGAQIFGDPDTAWHLAAGDLIWQSHAIPYDDPWSYVTQQQTWYNLSWLFDVGFSELFRLGGFSLLYVVTLLAFAGSYVFMAHQCIKRGASLTAVSITLLLALVIIYTNILARPNMVSIVFTVASYYFLCRFRDHGSARSLIALPVIMALWANMHGGFLLAFPLIGVFALEAFIAKDRKALQLYGICFAACIIATLINPYGYGVYYGAYNTLNSVIGKQYIIEWQAAKIGHDIPITLLLAAVMLAGDIHDRRIALSDRILAVSLLFLALSSARHSTVAAALTMPYLSLRLTSLLHDGKRGKRLQANETAIMADTHKTDVKWMGIILSLIAVGLLALPFPRDSFLKEPLGFPKADFPKEEAAFVEKNYPHLRFMTDYNIGGYLDYLWRGRVKIFIDGRADSLFSQDTLRD
jgi:hypothetical protein